MDNVCLRFYYDPAKRSDYLPNDLRRRAMTATSAIHTHEEDEKAIRALVKQWVTAKAAGDVDTVLGLMSDDVVFMTPGQEPFGKEAFRAQSEQLKGMKVVGKAEIQEIKVIGDDAW